MLPVGLPFTFRPHGPPPVPFHYKRRSLPARVMKHKFTYEEDQLLIALVQLHGENEWSTVAASLGSRNARQCRERFKNYLDPNLKRADWTPDEDALLRLKHTEYGAHWNQIARFFHGRSDMALRNRWNRIRHRRAHEFHQIDATPNQVTVPSPGDDPFAESDDDAGLRSASPIFPPSVGPEIDDTEPVQLTGHSIKTCDVFDHDLFDFMSSMNWPKA
jgi:hypothetical protein